MEQSALAGVLVSPEDAHLQDQAEFFPSSRLGCELRVVIKCPGKVGFDLVEDGEVLLGLAEGLQEAPQCQ